MKEPKDGIAFLVGFLAMFSCFGAIALATENLTEILLKIGLSFSIFAGFFGVFSNRDFIKQQALIDRVDELLILTDKSPTKKELDQYIKEFDSKLKYVKCNKVYELRGKLVVLKQIK